MPAPPRKRIRKHPPEVPHQAGYEPEAGLPSYLSGVSAPGSSGISTAVLFAAIVFGIVGYLMGESLFTTRPHPIHWLAAFGGIALGAAGAKAVAVIRQRHE